MIREPNLYDLERQGLRRYKHNPLFYLLTDEFDNAFREKEVDDDYVLEHYYVDKRECTNVTNEELFRRFSRGLKILTSSADLATETSDNPGLIYLLVGKKGIGKTILLKHYSKRVLDNIENNKRSKTVAVYLDLKNKKNRHQVSIRTTRIINGGTFQPHLLQEQNKKILVRAEMHTKNAQKIRNHPW